MMSYDEYLAAWAAAHSFEPERMGAFLRAYLRLPYGIARVVPGADPNLVTLAGLAVAVATLPLYARGLAFPAALLVLLSGLLDQVDGAVAAVGGRGSAFGAVLDSAVDRVTDAVLLLGPALWVHGAFARWGLGVAGAGTFLLEYVRARCQASGWTAEQVVTPAERPQRVVGIAVVTMLGSAIGRWVWAPASWALAWLTVASVLVLLRDARGRPTTPASG